MKKINTKLLDHLLVKILLTDNHFISLFSTLMESQSDHATFNFSYNDCAQDSKPLMKLIHANYNFTDYLNVYNH